MSLLIGAALSTLLVLNQHERSRLAADVTVRAGVASAVTPTADAIKSQLSQAAAAPAPGDLTVPAAGGGPQGPSPDSLTEARDSGTAVLDEGTASASIVVPIYRPGLPVATTAQRREAIDSYRIAPLTLLPVIDDLAPEGGGLLVRGPHGTVVARTRARPAGARPFDVDLDLTNQPGWRVETWLPDPGTPNSAWLGVGAILAVCFFAATALAVLQRQRSADVRRGRQLERERALVTGLAPVVQTSLDLARVVPAVSTHLVEGLALLGLGLSVPSETGERQLFTWGRAPDLTVPAMTSAPRQLGTGQTYALPLTRGGRVLGVLRIVAGEPLEQQDLQALATASELLGSTLANAEAFARQQVLVERMRSVDELKTIFLATASHELRTPVTAIVGFTGLLLQQWDTMDPTQGRQFLERVLSNAKGLETLIEQLLDFSRLERGLHPAGTELLDLGARVRAVLDEQPGVFFGHELRCDLAAGCTVRGSDSAVERIVTNLVGNAAKYSPAGTKITVTVRADEDRSVLVVDDEGSGVPEADRERVFSRFFRGSGDSVTSTRGAGIGLAIVAEYAASMSGTATVQAAPSGGARFIVSFPTASEFDTEGAQHVPLS